MIVRVFRCGVEWGTHDRQFSPCGEAARSTDRYAGHCTAKRAESKMYFSQKAHQKEIYLHIHWSIRYILNIFGTLPSLQTAHQLLGHTSCCCLRQCKTPNAQNILYTKTDTYLLGGPSFRLNTPPHRGEADSHLLQVTYWLGIRTKYNPHIKGPRLSL